MAIITLQPTQFASACLITQSLKHQKYCKYRSFLPITGSPTIALTCMWYVYTNLPGAGLWLWVQYRLVNSKILKQSQFRKCTTLTFTCFTQNPTFPNNVKFYQQQIYQPWWLGLIPAAGRRVLIYAGARLLPWICIKTKRYFSTSQVWGRWV